jgi:hypothetical protein
MDYTPKKMFPSKILAFLYFLMLSSAVFFLFYLNHLLVAFAIDDYNTSRPISNMINFKEYVNNTVGIKINYPSDWNIRYVDNSIYFSPSKSSSAYIEIRTEKLPFQYFIPVLGSKLLLTHIKSQSDCPNFINSSSILLSSMPANKLNFSCNTAELFAGIINFMQTTIYTTKSNELFEINYFGSQSFKKLAPSISINETDYEDYQKYLKTANEMINSFKII